MGDLEGALDNLTKGMTRMKSWLDVDLRMVEQLVHLSGFPK